MAERLQKYLARSGVASRRKAEDLMIAGRVTVNGVKINRPGISVTEKDLITVDGQPVKPTEHLVYYLVNKPRGVITTSADTEGRQTILDLVPKKPRVVACGRLDSASRGLILLTNDGELCYQLTHPKFEHEKEYRVTATINKGPALEERFNKLTNGVQLDDGLTAPAKIGQIQRQGMRLSFNITIHEGRNRQIRRMAAAVGLDVVDLVRTKIGKVELDTLPEGHWRLVKKSDLT